MGLYEKIKQLEAQAEALEKAKKKAEDELEQKERFQRMIQYREDWKKVGNIWLLLALGLVVAEIYLLSTGYEFSAADLAYIGIPLFLGLRRKWIAYRDDKEMREELNGVSVEKLPRQVRDLQDRVKDLDIKWKAAKGEYLSLTKYQGAKWDMQTFRATAENVAKLEKDIESLFVSVRYIAGSEKIVDNWLCQNRMKVFVARLNKEDVLADSLDRGFQEIGKTDSWKLKVLLFVKMSMDLALLSTGFGGEKPMSAHALMEKATDMRKPETEEEKEFYDAATTASIIMNGSLDYVIKRNMNQ